MDDVGFGESSDSPPSRMTGRTPDLLGLPANAMDDVGFEPTTLSV